MERCGDGHTSEQRHLSSLLVWPDDVGGDGQELPPRRDRHSDSFLECSSRGNKRSATYNGSRELPSRSLLQPRRLRDEDSLFSAADPTGAGVHAHAASSYAADIVKNRSSAGSSTVEGRTSEARSFPASSGGCTSLGIENLTSTALSTTGTTATRRTSRPSSRTSKVALLADGEAVADRIEESTTSLSYLWAVLPQQTPDTEASQTRRPLSLPEFPAPGSIPSKRLTNSSTASDDLLLFRDDRMKTTRSRVATKFVEDRWENESDCTYHSHQAENSTEGRKSYFPEDQDQLHLEDQERMKTARSSVKSLERRGSETGSDCTYHSKVKPEDQDQLHFEDQERMKTARSSVKSLERRGSETGSDCTYHSKVEDGESQRRAQVENQLHDAQHTARV